MNNENENIRSAAIVLAGGRGSRMESNIPKQYMEVCGFPLIYYCLKTFEDSLVDEIVLVCQSGDEEYCKREIVDKYDFKKITKIVAGGKARYHSVANGLQAIAQADIVYIHDGARPFVSDEIIKRAFDDVREYGTGVTAVPSKDTVKISDESGFAVSTPNRENVYIVQTPQTFRYEEILTAYKMLLEKEGELQQNGITVTDDAMVMELFGERKVKFTLGSYKNIKITTPEDILVARAYIEKKEG